MSERRLFVLSHDEARQRAVATVQCAPTGYRVTVEPPKRSLDQNSALWPLLQAFSEQRAWAVNGTTLHLTPEEWKDVLSASFQGEQMRMAPMVGGGGFVMIGLRTSAMGKARFSEFLDFIHASAADLGVVLEQEQAA